MGKKLIASGILAGVLATGIGFGNYTYATGNDASNPEPPQVTSFEQLKK